MSQLMWIEEGNGWIKEEKRIMDIEIEFPLFEILRLRMYSLERYKFWCVGVFFLLLPTPFIGLR